MYLGAVLTTLGQYDKALKLHEEGILIKRNRYGESHALLVSALREKGITLREMGNHNVAEAVFTEAIAMAEVHFDPQHFEVGLLQAELGKLYQAQQQTDRAQAALLQAVTLLTRCQRPEAAHYQALLESLAALPKAENKEDAELPQAAFHDGAPQNLLAGSPSAVASSFSSKQATSLSALNPSLFSQRSSEKKEESSQGRRGNLTDSTDARAPSHGSARLFHQRKLEQNVPVTTQSEYTRLTGLDLPVSSNFGVVVPDEGIEIDSISDLPPVLTRVPS
jgi:tetratricopeptide (TPR) repeat protein